MSPAPKAPKDLALAPVAAAVDLNLQRLRGLSPRDIDAQLQLELGGPAVSDTGDERAARVLAIALRDVDLHGWDAALTEDRSAVRLSGGSVSLDIAVSTAVHDFITSA